MKLTCDPCFAYQRNITDDFKLKPLSLPCLQSAELTPDIYLGFGKTTA